MVNRVGVLTFSRPPFNYFNHVVIEELLSALIRLDEEEGCRATVLCSTGAVFCAGGEFGKADAGASTYIEMAEQLYQAAMQLFRIRKPMVAAVQGSAIGGGLGLALVADFRVTCESAKFSANFSRLGLHPGFGLTVTLPRLIGVHNSELLFYTGRRINGAEALRLGLADSLVEKHQVKGSAIELAEEIASAAPIAVQDTRETMRLGLADEVSKANKHELALQKKHMKTRDFIEGVKATAERRIPDFSGN